MAKCILVIGGSRSGKSRFAQQLAVKCSASRAFIATCPVLDEEMEERVRKHRSERSTEGWRTIEEPVDLRGAIGQAREQEVVLVDCLTLWVSNLMFEAEERAAQVREETVARFCEEVLDACRHHPGTIVFVTNETGMGIVPENALSRRFRDLSGRANQTIAAGCEEVFLVVCGQPLRIKPSNL
jgi:adenosylcobinamide kinase/adenosylcobinamide-phosphate guanylyltransferase